MTAVSSLFRNANLIECGLWCVIGVGFAIYAGLRREHRLDAIVASSALVLFGLSDFVETRTGAWWRPWWLLAWKASCLLVFLILIGRYVGRRRLRKRS